MKKIFKNPLFMFVLGLVIAGSIGVLASGIFASDITYKETTVDKALDYLYTTANLPLVDRLDYTTSREIYIGNRKAGIKKEVSLASGNYIITLTNGIAWSNSSTFNTQGEANPEIEVSNGTCTKIEGYTITPTATGVVSSTSYHTSQTITTVIYKCSFSEDGTFSYTTASGDYANCPQGVIINTMKID